LSLVKRQIWMESRRMADLAFLYKPFLVAALARPLHLYCLETPHRSPFWLTTFPKPAAHTLFLAGSGSGKSLFNNVLVAAEAQHDGFLLVIDMADSYSFTIRSLGGSAATIDAHGPRINPFRQEASPQE
jgi:type IV secretory pathway VirB4 component